MFPSLQIHAPNNKQQKWIKLQEIARKGSETCSNKNSWSSNDSGLFHFFVK